MNRSLTAAQQQLLRRCEGGLRVWETGADLATLLADLGVLYRLGLVTSDEQRGYEPSVQGESLLTTLGVPMKR